ncbi:hypothetical protein BdWA1_002313 [Babesia duncani]|uniref:Uncharacterized protein n=1 Tax=Babesia duncani TaxID=323732 RepID=A0AAD9PJB2_9APIC|nr:hypothetical protein BdWA1_002313 [Babesia duncani]
MITRPHFSFVNSGKGRHCLVDKNPYQLLQVITRLSKKGVVNDAFIKGICNRVVALNTSLNPRILAFIANALGKAGITDVHVWKIIQERYHNVKRDIQYQDVALLLNGLTRSKCVNFKTIAQLVNDALTLEDVSNGRHTSVIINSLGRYQYPDYNAIASLIQRTKGNISGLSLLSIANLADGLFNLGHFDKVLVNEIGNEFKLRIESRLFQNVNAITSEEQISGLNPVQCVVLIYRFLAHGRNYNGDLYKAIFSFLINNVSCMKPIEMVIVANTMAISKRHDLDLIQAMSQRVLKKSQEFTYDMITMYIYGIHKSGYNIEFFKEIFGLAKKQKFTGVLECKHQVKMLELHNKFNLVHTNTFHWLLEDILSHLQELNHMDILSVIGSLSGNMDYRDKLAFLIDCLMQQDFESQKTKSQIFSRALYYICRFDDEYAQAYKNQFLDVLMEIPLDAFQPINVTNVLCAMEKFDPPPIFLDNMCRYIIAHVIKFTPQMLASCLRSIVKFQIVDQDIQLQVCKFVSVQKQHFRDEDLAHFLTYTNYMAKTCNNPVTKDTVKLYKNLLDIVASKTKTTRDINKENIEKIKVF